jgi:phosphinothricin acetyltransferase
MSAHTTHIRDATTAHLEAIRDIYNREVRESICTFDTQEASADRMRAWFDSHRDGHHPILVSHREGTIAGWASISAWSSRSAYEKVGETSVYVHRDHRGHGVGRTLYDELIDRAHSLGYRVLLARVAVPNPPSERLHEAVGFADIGLMREIGEKFGCLIDVRLMDMHLAHPSERG